MQWVFAHSLPFLPSSLPLFLLPSLSSFPSFLLPSFLLYFIPFYKLKTNQPHTHTHTFILGVCFLMCKTLIWFKTIQVDILKILYPSMSLLSRFHPSPIDNHVYYISKFIIHRFLFTTASEYVIHFYFSPHKKQHNTPQCTHTTLLYFFITLYSSNIIG